MKNLLQRFMDKVRSDWQWTGSKFIRMGYGRFSVNSKSVLAHRVSYELFNGPIPPGMDVLHSCDDPGCVDPDHLHLGDDMMNVREKINRGRMKNVKGAEHGLSVLSEEQVVEIRKLFSLHYSQRYLAKKYGVSQHTIYTIVNGQTWRHILPDSWKKEPKISRKDKISR